MSDFWKSDFRLREEREELRDRVLFHPYDFDSEDRLREINRELERREERRREEEQAEERARLAAEERRRYEEAAAEYERRQWEDDQRALSESQTGREEE